MGNAGESKYVSIDKPEEWCGCYFREPVAGSRGLEELKVLVAEVAELRGNQRPKWSGTCASCGNEKLKISGGWHCRVCELKQEISGLGEKFGKQMADLRMRLSTDSRERIAELNARIAELEGALSGAFSLLSKARSDIWQTARTNQGNINGADPITPLDAPCKEWIGNHFVHQAGVNESLEVVVRIDALLSTYSAMGLMDEKLSEESEKERRIHWQDLTYAAMKTVDQIIGGMTCEDTFKNDLDRVRQLMADRIRHCSGQAMRIAELEGEVEGLESISQHMRAAELVVEAAERLFGKHTKSKDDTQDRLDTLQAVLEGYRKIRPLPF